MTLIWDWNGTLLDDVDMAVRVTNEVFEPRGYAPLSREAYRRCFRFPVRDYYRDRGVGDEAFPEVAGAWSAHYDASFPGTPLFGDAAEAVKRLQAAGVEQVIVSASQVDMLRRQVDGYPELAGCFAAVLGIGDIYADGKVALARRYLAERGADPAEVVLVGDTCHDAEVAAALGCRCLLVDRGHQTREVIAAAGVPVVHSLREATELLLSGAPLPPGTARLTFTTPAEDMAAELSRNSLDEDNRRFVPDEVFETEEDARAVLTMLIGAAQSPEGPWVLPLLRREDGRNVGYVQASPLERGWEIGYHIAADCTGRGYATEAARAALPYFANRLRTDELLGVALEENAASCRVLEKCGMTLVFRGVADYQGEKRPVRHYRWRRA